MDKAEVVKAVNFLIQSPNYTRLIREITDIIERWDTHPMAYAGEMKFLSAMIDVGLESRDAFENLVSLIDSKRKLLPDIKRIDYQRDLMRERRARVNKAMELHELNGQLLPTSADKKQFSTDIQVRWKKARDEFIKAKGKLSWKERNAAAQEFWDLVDRQLDENIRLKRKRR